MNPRKTKRNMRSSKSASSPTPKRKSEKTAAALPEHRLRPGLEATIERVVQLEHTIQVVNPNLPAVFSTPSMIGLMEHATVQALSPELPPGAISVGTRIEVDHLKAVGIGATVRAWARFVKHKGRFLVFDVEARSGEHLIGRGRVFRAIVHPGEHGAKAQARVQQ
ncbi:MAG TPA: hotdog domain-containing protein [Candidatus Cybelea sp.]|jgi:fluoroacetyl-CoA thioesterase|nr:hotdog domain-containing protein [Candidatus Cybelea sp.]